MFNVCFATCVLEPDLISSADVIANSFGQCSGFVQSTCAHKLVLLAQFCFDIRRLDLGILQRPFSVNKTGSVDLEKYSRTYRTVFVCLTLCLMVC